MLQVNETVSQVFQAFKQVRIKGSQDMSLLELMGKFKHSRCVDPLDKAFALRGIASDGSQLVPRYDETFGDLFFRILSMLPTERILPPMAGCR